MDYFTDSLKSFISDVAYGGAVRKLFDSGMMISQIKNNLSFPATKEQILACIWQHLLDTGTVLLHEPEEKTVQYDFVRETDSYGRSTFRRIPIKNLSDIKYVPVMFGKMKYKKADFACLDAVDREYVEELPWPLETVYHIENERVDRIKNLLKN